MNKTYILLSIIFLFFLIAPGESSAQKDWSGVYTFGDYEVRIHEDCDQQFYEAVDVTPDPQKKGRWLLVCAPHKDGQETIGFLQIEDIINGKGGEKQKEKIETTKTEEEQVEEGGFSIWIQGMSEFITGNITCKEEDRRQPEKGSIFSMEGKIYIQRGLRTLKASTGDTLRGGDVLAISEGAKATIDLNDTGRLSISQKTRFQIPREPYTCPANKALFSIKSGLGSTWHTLKNMLKGEQYEIKTPSGTPGVRG